MPLADVAAIQAGQLRGIFGDFGIFLQIDNPLLLAHELTKGTVNGLQSACREDIPVRYGSHLPDSRHIHSAPPGLSTSCARA